MIGQKNRLISSKPNSAFFALVLIGTLALSLMLVPSVALAQDVDIEVHLEGEGGVAVFFDTPVFNPVTFAQIGVLGVDAYRITGGDVGSFDMLLIYAWTGTTLEDPMGVGIPLAVTVDDADPLDLCTPTCDLGPIASMIDDVFSLGLPFAVAVASVPSAALEVTTTINEDTPVFTTTMTSPFGVIDYTGSSLEKTLDNRATLGGLFLLSKAVGFDAGAETTTPISGALVIPGLGTFVLDTDDAVVAEEIEIEIELEIEADD